ncbi:MAG: glycosyltransferase family 39 protein [Bryobacterales bacterium]|nr:glycosyltransferase family 39 protein [Bryobacterales bacterium]
MASGTQLFQPSKVAAVLILGFVLTLFVLSSGKSTTSDESPHIAAGLSYVTTGKVILNTQHPPLLKLLAGLALRAGGVQWPDTAETRALETAHEPRLEWDLGKKIIGDNGGEHVMFWGRLPMILLAGLYAGAVFLLARDLLGPVAALCGLFLFVTDPLVLGHAYLVTTDTGFAGFTVLFLFTYWRYLQRGGRKLLVLSGMTLGLAMGCKFSGAALVPIAMVLYLVSLRRDGGDGRRGAAQHSIAIGGLFAVAFVVLYCLYLLPPDPMAYATGYSQVNADHIRDYRFYLAGEFGPHRSSYLAIAYLVKQPVASLLLAAIGLVGLMRAKQVSFPAKVLLLLPPLIFFAGYAEKAANIGVRYMIPVSVFLLMVGGFGLAGLLQSAVAWKKGTGVVLGLWAALAAVGVGTDHLSYFNELACASTPGKIGWGGGSSCGLAWLDDSNVDWGQGLPQVRKWIAENANGSPVKLAYFGSVSPSAFGVNVPVLEYTDLAMKQEPGLYIVSAHFVLRARPLVGGEWLRGEPEAVIGHSHYVYEVR